MSRTAIVPRSLVKNSNLDGATGPVTIDSTLVTAGVTIANAEPERTLLRVTNTNGTDRVLTVRKGTGPPALRRGQGDLTVTVAATSGVQFMGPFESDKVLQTDGSMSIDFGTSMTGVIDALLIPKV